MVLHESIQEGRKRYCLNKTAITMDRMERFFKIDQLLRSTRRSVPRACFIEALEVSPATFKRDLEYLRERMHAPIEYDSSSRGYRYQPGADFHLPGLWMNEGEIYALLTMQQLLSGLQPGLLNEHIRPIMDRVNKLLDSGNHSAMDVARRIRIISMASRPLSPAHFETVSVAVLNRKRLSMTYYSRASDSETERTVSPQRLIYYRDHWYLDTWCHKRDELRTFAIESIRQANMLDEKARNVSEKILDTELGSGYGIFTGSKTSMATLRFSPMMARWVETEIWHPQQQAVYDSEGYYLLSIPYSDDRELIQDILKYGANVEVLKPAALRRRVQQALMDAVTLYKD